MIQKLQRKLFGHARVRIAHTITILVCVCCLGGIALALFVGQGYREIDRHTTELNEDSRVFFVLDAIGSDMERWLISCEVAVESDLPELVKPMQLQGQRMQEWLHEVSTSRLYKRTLEQVGPLTKIDEQIQFIIDFTTDQTLSSAADIPFPAGRLDSSAVLIKTQIRLLTDSLHSELDLRTAELKINRDRFDRSIFLAVTFYLMFVLITWNWTALTTIYPLKQLTSEAKRSLEEGTHFTPPQQGPIEIQELSETVGSFVNELEDRVHQRTLELQAQKADLERHVAERRRLERRARNMALFAQLNPAPILRINFAGNVLMVNPAGEQLFGRDQLELLGTSIFDLIPALEIFDITELSRNGLITEQRVKIGSRYFQLIFTGVPEMHAIHMYSHDISEIVASETERKSLELQLQRTQRLETIGTLAGGIAHDFNNILTPILGYSEIALRNLTSNERRDELEHVIQAAYRAKDLVKQILTFSRQGDEERKPVELHLIIKEALKLLRASIPKSIEIRDGIDKQTGAVMADPSQIHQVIMNLCTNAYHAMREHGGVLEVRMDRFEVDSGYASRFPQLSPGPHARITVRDNGYGMEAATLERIFEPFFTTKGVGEGTGLGLSVVHGIIAKHQGAIQVESAKGAGTIFTILLPSVTANGKCDIRHSDQVPQGTERILFVDDEPDIVQMGEQILASLGYRVSGFTSSIEALQAFRSDPTQFDLVITDQNMPRMTGTELACELHRERREIPVILTTGFSEMITEDNYHSWGITALIMKPFVIVETAQAIRCVIDHQAVLTLREGDTPV